MRPRILLAVALTSTLGCVHYEYDHEFQLRLDGTGSATITGQPLFWSWCKGVGSPGDPGGSVNDAVVRRVLEASGLRVRRVVTTRRGGNTYVSAMVEFDDINRVATSAAFDDLGLRLERQGDRYVLRGVWRCAHVPPGGSTATPGLVAVRFHLPSKVYAHDNAVNGVERGNILTWREGATQALAGRELRFGAVMDHRSILRSTILLFATAIVTAAACIALILWLVSRRGRRTQAARPSLGGLS
jgi:hypothetical protein